jgi:hypothetical protein
MNKLIKISAACASFVASASATGLNFQTFGPTGDILRSDGSELDLSSTVRVGTLTGNATLADSGFTGFSEYDAGFSSLLSTSPIESSPNNITTPIAVDTLSAGENLWLLVEDAGETGVFYLGVTPGFGQLTNTVQGIGAGAGSAGFESGIAVGSFDGSNLRLAPVPEPSAFALIAGIFGLSWVMVRRRC